MVFETCIFVVYVGLRLRSFFPCFQDNANSPNRQIPILQCHGTRDTVLSKAVADLAAKTLSVVNPNYSLKIYDGMGHESTNEVRI